MNNLNRNNQGILTLVLSVLVVAILVMTYKSYGIKLAIVLIPGIVFLFKAKLGILSLALVFPFIPNELLILAIGYNTLCFLLNLLLLNNIRLKEMYYDLPLLLFLAVATISTLTSVDIGGSIRDLVIYYSSAIFIFILIHVINTKKDLYRLLLILGVGALIISVIGIGQFFLGITSDETWVDPSQNPDLTIRAFSVFGNPNILAEYLIMTGPLCWALAFGAKSRGKKLTFWAMAIAIALCLLLTSSRGGWLGFIGAILIFTYLKEKKYLLILVIGMLILALILPTPYINRFLTSFSTKDTSNAYRYILFQEGQKILSDHWLVGVGLGHRAFMSIYPKYMITNDKLPYHLHNTYLQLMVEIGVIGLLLFLWIVFRTNKMMLKLRTEDSLIKNGSIAIVASINGVLIHGFFENVTYMPKIVLMLFILMAIAQVLRNTNEGFEKREA